MERQPIDQDQTIDERKPNEPIVFIKRNWKSYLKEFFMLFLAISLGFFVENQRENYVEQKNAKVLARSMLEDIVKDTLALRAALNFNLEKDAAIENFLAMVHAPEETWDSTAFYEGMTSIFTTFPFSPTDGTYSQMKSSGTLRYFDQMLVNGMNAYDNQLKKTVYRDELIEKAEWELVPFAATVLNFEVTGELRFNKPITKEMYIHLKDKNDLYIFINKVVTVRTMMGRSLQEYKAQLEIGRRLIAALHNQYPQ